MKSITFLAVTALLAGQSSLADDAACKAALDAVTRVLATPNHQFMTRTDGRGGKPRHSEIIDTGIAMYVGVAGKWRTSPMSPQGMQDTMIESQKRARATTCKLLREESVGGASASVYSVHNETDSGVSDSTLWISKADGLPLKQEVDMDPVGGAGKSHSEVRFVYTDVKAPPGVE
jgi:hypothetical protein